MNNVIEEYLDEVPYMEYTYLSSKFVDLNFCIDVSKCKYEEYEEYKKYTTDPPYGQYIFENSVLSRRKTWQFSSAGKGGETYYVDIKSTYFINMLWASESFHDLQFFTPREEYYTDENLMRLGFKKFGFEGPLISAEPDRHYWAEWEVWAKAFIFRYPEEPFTEQCNLG